MSTHTLTTTLEVAVPLRIWELKQRGGPSDEDYAWLSAYVESGELAECGDELLYRSRKSGVTAGYFTNLAKAMAIMAFQPGGVKFAGTRYEATS